MEYDALNTALNEYFFSDRFEMLPIYLDLEGDAEAELTETLGLEPGELGDYVGLCTAQSLRFDKTDPYTDQVKLLKSWSKKGRSVPPPFTALLVALSIAAERMGADESFSSNNYYERLFELLGVDDTTHQQKLKQYAKSTQQFWRALNLWLSENDFLLGRPTAKPLMSHWQYVSYALSQALVRDGDRKRFSGLFEKYDLVPGDPVSEAEMTILLHEWMASHGATGPTSWLRKLWSSNDLRERIVVAALDAFESWERSDAHAPNDIKRTRLQWQLGFTGFPRKRAILSLATARGGQAEVVEPDQESEIFHDNLRLEDGHDGGNQFLGPSESINLDLLLLQSTTFTGTQSGINYEYVAKPIIPFASSSDGPALKEISRVSLFEEHAILCHEKWFQTVEKHLATCARLGYAVLGPDEMSGIPTGWRILRGVKIIRPADNAADNLHALTPISSIAAIACTEGLQLGHGTWHSDAPPTVEATSEKKGSRLEIVREQFGEKDEVLVTSDATREFMEARLDDLQISGGTNIRAIVKAKTEIAETSFSLRNADIPRPLGNKRLFHPVVEGKKLEHDSSAISVGTSDGLEGCLVTGRLPYHEISALRDQLIAPASIPSGTPETLPKESWRRSINSAVRAIGSCVIRGYHYWKCEEFRKGDDRFDAKWAECKDCHIKALFHKRKASRSDRARVLPATRMTPDGRLEARKFKNQVEADGIDDGWVSLDIIFDGLCYLGEGTLGSFKRLSSRASPEPWFASSFASDLFTLGNLEIRNALQASASEWSVPPPVLVLDFSGNGRLAGFHSKTLLEKISNALERDGARHEALATPGQVTVHRWSGLKGVDVEGLLSDALDPHERPIAVGRNLGRDIAGALLPLEEAWEQGEPVYIEHSDSLEKFDVHNARWKRADKMDSAGAYRVGLHGTRYVFRDASATTRQVGHQVAKILAARAEGLRLHGYDAQTGRFTSALGAEPPGLFSRALVASSGTLPTIEDGHLVYANVDPLVATLILNKIYEKDLSHG